MSCPGSFHRLPPQSGGLSVLKPLHLGRMFHKGAQLPDGCGLQSTSDCYDHDLAVLLLTIPAVLLQCLGATPA